MAWQAAIFDMDGTLVDNMGFHVRAWMALADRLGIPSTPEVFERTYAGKKNEEILPLLLGRAVPAPELAALAFEKESAYRSLCGASLRPLAGAVEFLEELDNWGIRCSVATAAPPENRALVLVGLGMGRHFERVIGAEDAPRGKPHPDLYLAASRAMGLEPAQCIAFEDAVNGVLSARAAGMEVVALLTGTPEALLRDAGASWAMNDFRRLPDDLRRRLFG